jgi:hypothetical protein
MLPHFVGFGERKEDAMGKVCMPWWVYNNTLLSIHLWSYLLPPLLFWEVFGLYDRCMLIFERHCQTVF